MKHRVTYGSRTVEVQSFGLRGKELRAFLAGAKAAIASIESTRGAKRESELLGLDPGTDAENYPIGDREKLVM